MRRKYVLVPRLKILNANAASTPYTAGFPAMTAWMGAVHALERGVKGKGVSEIRLSRVAVSSHKCELQSFRGVSFEESVIGKGQSILPNKKRSALVVGPFCHLEVSLLIGVDNLDDNNTVAFEGAVRNVFMDLRIAGGDTFLTDKDLKKIRVYAVEEDSLEEKRLRNRLMPGFVLVGRPELLERADGVDALDAMLDVIQRKTPTKGWNVPIAVGFKDLSGAIRVRGQRSYDTEHHFVEPVCTMGEFIMPYHFEHIEDMMWHYDYDKQQGLYLCKNN